MTINITVSDLRQFEYCARIPYFTHVLGLARVRPVTYKMREGLAEHERVRELEERRSLRSYGLKEGERHFEVRLVSEALQLSGRLDLLVVSGAEALVVEYKNDLHNRIGTNHRLQLAAYALMVEEQWKLPVRRAFLHFIPTKKSFEVPLTANLKDLLRQRLVALKGMVEHEVLPDATAVRGRCVDCEFSNLCPDVW